MVDVVARGMALSMSGITAAVTKVNGKTGAVTISKSDIGLSNVDNTADADKPISDATQTALDNIETDYTALIGNCVQTSSVGTSGGVASLDSSGVVPDSQISDAIKSGLTPKGEIDVTTGSVDAASDDNSGWFYRNSVAGTSSITGTSETWAVNDWLVSANNAWQHWEMTTDNATTETTGVIKLAGDLSGTATDVVVSAVNGISAPTTAPTTSRLFMMSEGSSSLMYDNIEASDLPAATSSAQGVIELAGDLGGTSSSPIVEGIQGYSVITEPTAVNDILYCSSTDNKELSFGTMSASNLSAFTAATSSADGEAGVVPAPSAGDENSFLRGDATWSGVKEYLSVSGATDTISSYTGTQLNINTAAASGHLQVAGTNYLTWGASALSPVTDNAYSLGTSSLGYSVAYANTLSSTDGTLLISASDTGIGFSIDSTNYYYMDAAAFRPIDADVYTCGSGDYPWSAVYTSGVSNASGGLSFSSSGAAITFSIDGTTSYYADGAAFRPTTTNTYILGSADYVWNNVYTNYVSSDSSTTLTLSGVSGSIAYSLAGTNCYYMDSAAFRPIAAATYACGSGTFPWSATYSNGVSSGDDSPLTLNAANGIGYLSAAGTGVIAWQSGTVLPMSNLGATLGATTQAFSMVATDAVSSATNDTLYLNGTGGAIAYSVSGTNTYYMDSSAFRPIADSAVYCGLPAYPWGATYTNTVSSGNDNALYLNAASGTGYITASNAGVIAWSGTAFNPITTNAVTLGSSSNTYSSVYANTVASGTGSNLTLRGTSGSIFLGTGTTTTPIGINSTELYPTANNSVALGQTDSAFSSVYTYVCTSPSSLSLAAAGTLYMYAKGTQLVSLASNTTYGANFSPVTSGGVTLGSSIALWGQIYSTSATVSTSDERKKTDWEEIPDALLSVWFDYVKIRSFKWIDEATGTKRNVGITAQQVISAFEAADLDWTEWHLIEEAEDGTYLVSYSEIQMIEAAAIKYKLGI